MRADCPLRLCVKLLLLFRDDLVFDLRVGGCDDLLLRQVGLLRIGRHR